MAKYCYILIVICLACIANGQSVDQIQTVSPHPAHATFNKVYFFNGQFGCAIGEGGQLFTTANSGGSWDSQKLPTDAGLRDVFFATKNLGWLVTDSGEILHTANGGKSWMLQHKEALPLGQKYPSVFTAVYFVSPSKGFVGGSGNYILGTEDGGKTWKKVFEDSFSSNCTDIKFVNNQYGYCIGSRNYYTKDGGKTWVRMSTYRQVAVRQLLEHQGSIWILANTGLAKSKDFGDSWEPVSLEEGNKPVKHLERLAFGELLAFTDSHLYRLKEGGAWEKSSIPTYGSAFQLQSKGNTLAILQSYSDRGARESLDYGFFSTDGGRAWVKHTFPNKNASLSSIALPTATTIVAAGERGMMLLSQDSGQKWVSLNKTGSHREFKHMHFVDDRLGHAVGEEGVFESIDGGRNWELVFEPKYYNPISRQQLAVKLNKLYFQNERQGWAVGGYALPGLLYKTDDGGSSWEKVLEESRSGEFQDIVFSDEKNAWLISKQKIYKSSDAGASWQELSNVPRKRYYFSLHAWDSKHIYIADSKHVIYTEDGGESWHVSEELSGLSAVYDMHFTDGRNGWASGKPAILMKTADGGASWERSYELFQHVARDIHFIDKQNAWVAFVNESGKANTGGVIYTSDGGASWQHKELGFPANTIGIRGSDVFIGGTYGLLTAGAASKPAEEPEKESEETEEPESEDPSGEAEQPQTEIEVDEVAEEDSNKIVLSGGGLKTSSEQSSSDTLNSGVQGNDFQISLTANGIKLPMVDTVSVGNMRYKGFLKKPTVLPLAFQQSIMLDTTEEVYINTQRNYVYQATVPLGKPVKIRVKDGKITLKPGSKISLYQNKQLKAASLATDARLILESGMGVTCLARVDSDVPDVLFEVDGALESAYIGLPMEVAGMEFLRGSRLQFSNGRVTAASPVTSMEVELEPYRFKLMSDLSLQRLIVRFDKKTAAVTSVVVDAGHYIRANEVDIPVLVNSTVVLDRYDGSYVVSKFSIQETMDLDVYKKNKVKRRTVKAGRTLTLEDGKIVKVSLL